MSCNKRRTSSFQVLTVSLIGVIFLITALVGLYKCFSKAPTIDDKNQTNLMDPADPSQTDPDGLFLQASGSTDNRKDRFYTILIGGLDDENGGSDTNMLVSLDADNGTIHVVSLPRDTLLNVTWSVKKLNNAYHHGGFTRTMEEVSNLLGIPVDFYVTVNLQGFVQLVDAINGVQFDIPVDMNYDDPYQNLHIHFSKGIQHLYGEDALKVVRWRQNNDGSGYTTADLGRIDTQQAFLMTAARQMLQLSNWDKLPQYVEIFRRNVDTDLEISELIWIGEQILTIGSEGITFHTLPGDGTGYYKGGSYYVLDKQATLEMINNYFNPFLEPLTPEDMDILVP